MSNIKILSCCIVGALLSVTALKAFSAPNCNNLKDKLEKKINATCTQAIAGTLNCTIQNTLDDNKKSRLEKIGCTITDKKISCSCDA